MLKCQGQMVNPAGVKILTGKKTGKKLIPPLIFNTCE